MPWLLKQYVSKTVRFKNGLDLFGEKDETVNVQVTYHKQN